MRNETFLKLIINNEDLINGIWDPFNYRNLKTGIKLSDYVVIKKIKKRSKSNLIFEPIRYSDIPKGNILIYKLKYSKLNNNEIEKTFKVVGEQTILFGTMRAYLANIIVTPCAEWIGLKSPIYFPAMSEFVEVIPNDNLVYFWWAYLIKKEFLSNLPKGHGGTRPRIESNIIGNTPISIPNINIRRDINIKLSKIAERDWKSYMEKVNIIDSLKINIFK